MKEIILKQEERRKLDIELSPGADYSYTEEDPDIISYDKATQIVTASTNNTSKDARVTFTPHKNGYDGDTVILKSEVIEKPTTRIELTYYSLEINESEEVIISIITDAPFFTLEVDNNNIKVEKITSYKFKVTGLQQGTSNITVKAQASEKKPHSVVISVNINQGIPVPPTPVINKFFMGQIPTNTADWDWDVYDANPSAFDLEPLVNRTAVKGQLQEFNYDDIVNKTTSFQGNLGSLNSFLWFAFEKGSGDNLDFNSTSNFEPLSKYPISDTKKYELTRDIGNGLKTYTILVTTTYRQSIPQLYIRK